MEIISEQQFSQELSGGSSTISPEQFSEEVNAPEEEGFFSRVGDSMLDYGSKALDYMANPQEGADLNTYNIRKEDIKPYVAKSFQEDTSQLNTDKPSLDENYIQALTQRMMEEENLTPGDSVKVLRRLKELTGQPVGARESLIARRYLKNPSKWSGISPAESMLSGAAQMGAGVGQTLSGMATGVGDLLTKAGAEDIGGELQEAGQDWASRFGAYRDVQKERTGSDMLGEMGAIAPMVLPTRMASTFATTYGYGRGQGMGEGQSAITGAVDALLVGGLNRLLGGKKSISAKELRDKGLRAFDKKLITTDASDLIERIEATTGKNVDDIIRQTADYMDTVGRESLTEDQIVRMAVENITGGTDYSPRAGKYLMGAEALDSTTAPIVMKEAQARTDDVRQALSKNPKLAELVDSFTTKVGNFEATDWHGLGEALRDYGIPTDSDLLQRVASYGNIDDVAMLRSMQGADPVATKNISRVGQRENWESQAKAEVYDKLRQAIYARIPGVNKDAKIEQAIIDSLKDPTITPSKLKQSLVDAGVPVARISDNELDAALSEIFPDSEAGRAGGARQPEGIGLIDEAEFDARLAQNKANVEENWPIQRIIDEFSEYGEDLDNVLQQGLDSGLRGGKLRNYVYSALKGNSANMPREIAGAQAGWDVDEDGNITYDPVKGAMGAAVGNMTRGRGSIVNRLATEGLSDVGQKINKATGVDINPNIIPNNSSMGERLTAMKAEGASPTEMLEFFDANKGTRGNAYSGNDFTQFMNNIGNKNPYKMISKGVEASKLLPNKQPLKGQELVNAMKSRGVSADELKFSGFEDYANSLKKPVHKQEVEQWWKDNSGKELPMGESDSWEEYTARDYSYIEGYDEGGMPIESPDRYSVDFREYPKVNQGLTKNFRDFGDTEFKSTLYDKLDATVPTYGDADYDPFNSPAAFSEIMENSIPIGKDIDPDKTLALIDQIESGLKSTDRLSPERKLALSEARGMVQEEKAKPSMESFLQTTKDRLEELSWSVSPESEKLHETIRTLKTDPRPNSYGIDNAIQRFREEADKAYRVTTEYKAGTDLDITDRARLSSARMTLTSLTQRLDEGPAEDAVYKAIDYMGEIPEANLNRTKELYDLIKKELSTAKQHLIGDDLESLTRRIQRIYPRLDEAVLNKTKTDIPDYSPSIMAQVNEQLDKTLDMARYSSKHMASQEPMYLRTSMHTKGGKERLVIQEPQSDAFAGKDTSRLKASGRMPYASDWLEKDLEDAAMKAMREGADEIVIPLSSADSETDMFMIGGKLQEKPIKSPQSISETQPFYRDATVNREFIGEGKKTKSATTPIYYNSIVVNQANKLAKRLGAPVSYETVGNTNSLVIDISNIESPTFSLYGKPGQFK